MSTLTPVTTRAGVRQRYLRPVIGGSMCKAVGYLDVLNQAEWDEFAARHHRPQEVLADLPLCLLCARIAAESSAVSGPGAVTA